MSAAPKQSRAEAKALQEIGKQIRWVTSRKAARRAPKESPMTPREREGLRRLELLRAYDRLRKGGLSGACAAALLKTGEATLWRWQKRLEEFGPRGLEPRTFLCGRKSQAKLWGVDEQVIKRVTALHFALGSNCKAWRAFAGSKACPRKLAAALRRAKQIPQGMLALTRLNRRTVKALAGKGFPAFMPAGFELAGWEQGGQA